jgi:hypothetical protein
MVVVVAVASREARAQAPSYEPIRVDFGLAGGYASGLGEGGFGGVVEPKYLVTDHLAVGPRVEGMVTFGASVGDGDGGFSTGSVGAVLAKAELLVGSLATRPVVGIAFGVYGIGGDTIETGPGDVIVKHKDGRYVGMAPSAGIELGRVRLAVTYHMMLGAKVVVERTPGDASSREDFSQNFFSFELSVHVGGTRLAPRPTATLSAR